MTDQLAAVVLLANVASTLMLVGLIWFVQLVHYPQFAQVGPEHFVEYEATHVRATTLVVALPMLVEALTAAVLAWRPPSPDLAVACWAGLALVIGIWSSTASLQVPRHNELAKQFDPVAHRRLVLSNWLRTVGWSMRGALVLFMLSRMSAGGLDHGQ